MASSLTQADVARLLAEPSASARAEVADKLAREIDSTPLTEAELADRAGHRPRHGEGRGADGAARAVAEPAQCRGICRTTWRCGSPSDVEAVALPILADSPVLTDADLVDLVRKGSAPKQEAIAGRADVSEPCRRRAGDTGRREPPSRR